MRAARRPRRSNDELSLSKLSRIAASHCSRTNKTSSRSFDSVDHLVQESVVVRRGVDQGKDNLGADRAFIVL